MNTNCFIKNNFAKFILIKGKDSANFLQGLITNDINKSSNGKAIYSCLLSPQGKFLADFFIYNQNEEYLIEINEQFFQTFCDKLNMYKLRSNVEIIKIKHLQSYIVFGNQIDLSDKSIIVFNDPRNHNLGKKIYVNSNSEDLVKLNTFKELKFDFYKEELMKNLIPNATDDLIENKSLLLENNFQNINAIDWSKGCYVGQEITARMKYRSLLKKQIYVLELLSGNIDLNENIILDNINIGNIISKTNKYVLCMLRIKIAEPKKAIKEKIKINNSVMLRFL